MPLEVGNEPDHKRSSALERLVVLTPVRRSVLHLRWLALSPSLPKFAPRTRPNAEAMQQRQGDNPMLASISRGIAASKQSGKKLEIWIHGCRAHHVWYDGFAAPTIPLAPLLRCWKVFDYNWL